MSTQTDEQHELWLSQVRAVELKRMWSRMKHTLENWGNRKELGAKLKPFIPHFLQSHSEASLSRRIWYCVLAVKTGTCASAAYMFTAWGRLIAAVWLRDGRTEAVRQGVGLYRVLQFKTVRASVVCSQSGPRKSSIGWIKIKLKTTTTTTKSPKKEGRGGG